MENIIEEEEYEDLYTGYDVTEPPLFYRRWGFNGLIKKALKRMNAMGIVTDETFSMFGVPMISFTSRCDRVLDPEEFKGRIRFGKNVFLHSMPQYYPLRNDVVRITVVKTRKGTVGEVIIGNDVRLPGITIVSYNRVTIGNNVLLGPLITILDCSGHALTGRAQPGELDRLKSAPVEIADGAWIGQGACILKGVRIGKNSVVGINAVVHESVPDNTVVAGNPARVIKTL